MTFVAKSRVRETSTTGGVGALTLAGAVADHQRFSAVMSVNDTCWYAINQVGSNKWEIGVGTYSALNTLTRTTLLESSTGSTVSFDAGVTAEVAMVFPGSLASHANNSIEETLASAGTTNLGSVGTRRVAISGTATITSFGTTANLVKFLRFTGAMTITHNASTLICPAGVNILTASGDTAVASSDASGNWRIWHYQRTANAAGSAFPPGTAMPFYQASAPTGWTKSSSNHDKSVRIVNDGSGGTASGNVVFSTVFGIQNTGSHTLTQAETPSHTHGTGTLVVDSQGAHIHNVYIRDPGHTHSGVDTGTSALNTGAGGTPASGVVNGNGNTNSNTTGIHANDGAGGSGTDDQTTNNGSHTHNISGSTGSIGGDGGHTHPIDLRVQYLNMIVATKD